MIKKNKHKLKIVYVVRKPKAYIRYIISAGDPRIFRTSPKRATVEAHPVWGGASNQSDATICFLKSWKVARLPWFRLGRDISVDDLNQNLALLFCLATNMSNKEAKVQAKNWLLVKTTQRIHAFLYPADLRVLWMPFLDPISIWLRG